MERKGADYVKKDEIESVLYFSLMWNAFEHTFGGTPVNPKTIDHKFKEHAVMNSLTGEDFQPFLLYFQDRYVGSEEADNRFAALKLKDQSPDRNRNIPGKPVKSEVLDVLHSREKDNEKIILALLYIVWRIRNNLFHANKTPIRLEKEAPLLNVANTLLAIFMDAMRR